MTKEEYELIKSDLTKLPTLKKLGIINTNIKNEDFFTGLINDLMNLWRKINEKNKRRARANWKRNRID